MEDDIFVRIVPLPAHVHGMTAPGPDGYNIYLDASQSDQERMKAYQHELEHIRHDDWNSGDDISGIESQAHGVE